MGGIGFGELILILVILVVVFGAGRLPQIGDALGKAIRSFKRAATENDDIQVVAKSERQGELPRSDKMADAVVEPSRPKETVPAPNGKGPEAK